VVEGRWRGFNDKGVEERNKRRRTSCKKKMWSSTEVDGGEERRGRGREEGDESAYLGEIGRRLGF